MEAKINVKGVVLGLLTRDEAKGALDLLQFYSTIIFVLSHSLCHHHGGCYRCYLTVTSFDKKERYLLPVIQMLQNDALPHTSTAKMQSHVMRAQGRLENGMREEA